MHDTIRKRGLIVIKALLSVAFLGAGFAKLSGQEMMIATYETLGLGQWFRYVTGIIEVGGAVALWIRGLQGWGAAFLAATMVGAILAHWFILGPSAAPAIVLGIMSAVVLWAHRDQLPILRNISTR